VTPFVTGGAGFLLAVLWFDLMFDVQVLGHGDQGRDVPEDVLASVSAYYRRVTTTARPMNRLVGLVMLGTIAAILTQLARGDAPRWVAWASLALAGSPVARAAVHTLPAAVRLGAGSGRQGDRSETARSICRDHLLCLASVASLLVIQLGFAR
jgi:hypothetical protein